MRFTEAAQRKVLLRSDIKTASLPAPVEGWDAISGLADMPIKRAVQLDNWVPRPGWIEPRRGYIAWATDCGSDSTPVETIMSFYAASTAANQMFAVAGGTFYDTTTQGTAVATTVTGMTNSRWQYCNFSNTAGNHFLIACNGLDNAKIYDGAAWADLSVSGDATADQLVQPHVYAGRLWFVVVDSLAPVYLDLGAISGALTEFPLGSFLGEGGFIEAMDSWSVDTRQTIDDYLAFISSRGQVIVYVGTDPSDATNWQEVGLYNLGRPLGRRCAVKLGGDLAVLTIDGLTSMNSMLVADRSGAKAKTLTINILGAINQATSSYGDNVGWQFVPYPKDSLAFLNIPVSTNQQSMQFVVNTLTKAWCRFININALVWEIFEDDIYFGGTDGTVYLYDYDSADNGVTISCTAKSAFSYFDDPGYTKRFTMLQPVLTSDGTVVPGTGINVDFGQGGVISTPNISTGSGPFWDSAIWDTSVWPAENVNQLEWITVSGIGHCASVITQVVTGETGTRAGVNLQLNAWQLMFERGAPL